METGLKRESMVFYESFFEAIKDLPAEQFKECACTILNYGLNGKEPESSGVVKSIFVLIKPQIDKNNQRWSNAKKSKVLSDTSKKSSKEKAPEIDKNIAEAPIVKAEKIEEIISSSDEDDDIVFDDLSEILAEVEGGEEISQKDIPEYCGEFSNVLLSANEREKLINRFGVREYNERLEFFSMYLKKKPDHKSACHYVDLCDWVGNAVDERRDKKDKPKSALSEFTFEDFYEVP